jgi:hypothetical protein
VTTATLDLRNNIKTIMKYWSISKIRSAFFKWNEIIYKYQKLFICMQTSALELKLTCIMEPVLDVPSDTTVQGKVKL